MKLALLGSTSVGKTTLGHYLSGQPQPLDYISTIGVDIMYIRLEGNKKITIYDLAGEDRFKKICESFIMNSDILAFCFNQNDYASFVSSIKRYNECIKLGYTFQKKIIFIATKADKSPFENYTEVIEKQLGANMVLLTTSSKAQIGRDEVLDYLESTFPQKLALELHTTEPEEFEVYYKSMFCTEKCIIT